MTQTEINLIKYQIAAQLVSADIMGSKANGYNPYPFINDTIDKAADIAEILYDKIVNK